MTCTLSDTRGMDKLSIWLFFLCSSKYKIKFLSPVGKKKKKLLYKSYVGFGLPLHFAVKRTSTIVFLLKELLLRFIVCLLPWRNTKHFSNCSLDLASFCALTASCWLEWCSQHIKISPYGSTCRSGPQGTICRYAKRIKALWRKETLYISAQSFHLGFVPCGRRGVMSFQE